MKKIFKIKTWKPGLRKQSASSVLAWHQGFSRAVVGESIYAGKRWLFDLLITAKKENTLVLILIISVFVKYFGFDADVLTDALLLYADTGA